MRHQGTLASAIIVVLLSGVVSAGAMTGAFAGLLNGLPVGGLPAVGGVLSGIPLQSLPVVSQLLSTLPV